MEDLKTGEEVLSAMDAGDTPGTRESVDRCELKVEIERIARDTQGRESAPAIIRGGVDPEKKRKIRLVVALSAAVLLATALVYTSFSASTEAKSPSELLAERRQARSRPTARSSRRRRCPTARASS